MIDDIQLARDAPLQAQLHDILAERILAGRYPPGQRLPASRHMARTLGLSRNTVNAVLEQLRAEGFLHSRRGAGWFVNRALPPAGRFRQLPRRASGERPPLRLSGYGRALVAGGPRRQEIDLPLTPGIPDLGAFPLRAWNRILHHHESRRGALGFDGFQGLRYLREILADYLRASRGLSCSPEQIIITQGAQQAIALVAKVLLDSGDPVLMENPGYGGARRAFASVNARIEPVAVGPHGLAVARLPQQPRARLLYCTPTHQYPLGGILPVAERLQLLDWAARHRIWLLEDDYDSEFHFYQKPIPALQGLVDPAPVIYVGSFSKVIFPALRLGYLVAPEPLVEVLVRAKGYMGGESPQLLQYVTAEFIEQGLFGRHLRRMRQLYQSKWEQCLAVWRRELAGRLEPVAESAGMHLVFRGQCEDLNVQTRMRHAGFGVTALTDYYCAGQPATGFVVGYANASPEQISDGITRLAAMVS